MKKAALAVLLLIPLFSIYADDQIYTWDEIETELHNIAKEFISVKRSTFIAETGVWKRTSSGFFYVIGDMSDITTEEAYGIVLILKNREKPEYRVPNALQDSVMIGASKKLTSLYGEPYIQEYTGTYWESTEYAGAYRQTWECTSWYFFAQVAQNDLYTKDISLVFYEKDF